MSWTWQALGIEAEMIGVAEPHEEFRTFIHANHAEMVQHMHRTMEDQVQGCSCLHHAGGRGCELSKPDLGILGTPCNPFSGYRKQWRVKPGTVENHKLYDVTFSSALEWLEHFHPPTCVLEQVEGFTSPLSCDVSETPFDRLLACLLRSHKVLFLTGYSCARVAG